jgi:hypothetical protein
MSGAIASSTRLSSFIREQELRGLRFCFDTECMPPDGLSVGYGKGSLADIFVGLTCPVLHLGYVARHVQRWINLGTHLGEVVHSVSLAPGESRNIAIVDWRRRSRTSRAEETSVREQIVSHQLHNRALEEVARAVAEEHQFGKTSSEASTAATSASFVAAGAVVGGVAGAVVGGIGGGVTGLAIDTLLLGADVGAGTVAGTLVGGAAGGVAGAAVGSAAGGMVYSGAHSLGLIESSSAGDRDVVGGVHQNIAQSVSQKSSAIRSLWSAIVVEDAQAEQVAATTSNITNYNHMHALNLEYYEVLQHYLMTIALDRAEPVLYLPFTGFNFTGLNYVVDYWDAIRPHLSPSLRERGDMFLVEMQVPDNPPTPEPVPPLPTPPYPVDDITVDNLILEVLFTTADTAAHPVQMLVDALTGLRVSLKLGGVLTEAVNILAVESPLTGWTARKVEFLGETLKAVDITGVAVEIGRLLDFNTKIRIKVKTGNLRRGSQVEDLAGTSIAMNAVIPAANSDQVKLFAWTLVTVPAAEQVNCALPQFHGHHDCVVARNQAAMAAYEDLVLNEQRFLADLEKTIQRRRHFFTRVILSAIEPERIIQLLELLCFEAGSGGDALRIPLHVIAHTIPIGMTNSSFLLRLKPWKGVPASFPGGPQQLAQLEASLQKAPDMLALLSYSHELGKWFDEVQKNGAYGVSEHVYLPTGGLFAEAILGRSNAAEVLDITRFFNWQDSPIPNPAPTLQPVSAESQYQTPPQTAVTVPPNSINLVNPVNFPDPTGLKEVLTAVRTGDMFRDMSKAEQLTTILGGLATLAGKMGEVSAKMTGEAAQQAMQSATEIGKAVSQMTGDLAQQAFKQMGSAPQSLTEKGATVNKLTDQLGAGPDLDNKVQETLGLPPDSPDTPSPAPSSPAPAGAGSPPPSAPAVPAPGVTPAIQKPGESTAQQTAAEKVKKLIQPTPDSPPQVPAQADLVAVGMEWFGNAVLPGLQAAASDDALLAPALTEWLDWQANQQALGVDTTAEIAGAVDQAQIWAVGGLRNAVQSAADRAVAGNDWRYLLDALAWSAEAQMLALASSQNRLGQQDVLEDFPLRVQVLEAQFPDVLGADQSATLAARAGLVIQDNPPILSQPLAWTVTATGGSISGPASGATNSQGGFAAAITRAGSAALALGAEAAFLLDGLELYSTQWSKEVGLP